MVVLTPWSGTPRLIRRRSPSSQADALPEMNHVRSVMTGFLWNGLVVGDRVYVHTAEQTDRRALQPGVVAMIDGRSRAHGVGIELSAEPGTTPRGSIVWPSRLQVH